MRYKEFFRIEIDHQYHLPEELVDLVIVPDAATHRLLKGQRFIIREMLNGIRVLIPVDEEGSAIPVLQADDQFTFEIFPTSDTFYSITALPALTEGEIMSFTNAGLSEEDTQLVSSVANGSGALHGFPLVANVTIRVSDLLLDSNNVPKTPEYTTVFEAKTAKWRYYFISDPETIDLSIHDVNEQLVFNEIDVALETEDKIISSLQSNFPDTGLFLFESEAPIAFQSQAIKKLQLLRNAEVLINHLPNPDTKDSNFRIIKIHK